MTLLEAAADWDKLAEAKENRATSEVEIQMGTVPVLLANAKLYRDTATALRLQQETGVVHCSCHLKPLGEKE